MPETMAGRHDGRVEQRPNLDKSLKIERNSYNCPANSMGLTWTGLERTSCARDAQLKRRKAVSRRVSVGFGFFLQLVLC